MCKTANVLLIHNPTTTMDTILFFNILQAILKHGLLVMMTLILHNGLCDLILYHLHNILVFVAIFSFP